MLVTVYQKPGCHLCEDVLDILDRLIPEYRLEVRLVNILDDMSVYQALKEKIPVVEVGDGRFGRLVVPIDEAELRTYFDMIKGTRGPQLPLSGASVLPQSEPAGDRVASYIGRHWLRFVCVALGVFVGLAWLAAVFAALGWWGLADPIYTAYALTCHQLPERAGTLFGYQVAFCFRNTALYAGILGFGVLYGLARDRKVPFLQRLRKPVPWWVFVLLLAPMFVDGVTHMLGVRDSMADMGMEPSFGSFFVGSQAGSFNWWLRILTALMAALGGVWFAFPRMDGAVGQSEAMRVMYQQYAASQGPVATQQQMTGR